MPYIVNLSSLHTLHPVSVGAKAFSRLCDRYAKGCCARYCCGFFSSGTHLAWVALQYHKKRNTLINPYKLGQMNSQEFLDGLLQIFSFLNDENIEFFKDDLEMLWKHREQLITLKNVKTLEDFSKLTKKQIAFALLEHAWNAIIDFRDQDTEKLAYLIREAKGDNIYLISNTTELNVYKLLSFLRKNFSGIAWEDNVDLSVQNEAEPLKIAPNIYLCSSHKYGKFKGQGTDGLLHSVVEKTAFENMGSYQVVSQFRPDREAAKTRGIPQGNIHSASDFYPQLLPNTAQQP